MHNEFTSVIEENGDGSSVIALRYRAQMDRAAVEECRDNLSQAIALILEDRREDGLRGVPQNAIRDTVVVQ